ncbi:MAG: thioredoxin family protein [Firmicutes bacterium]|nr:thioredoxin family protein [Bacillota bacterium]
MRPVVSKVAETESNVNFYLVDVQQSPDLARRFGITGVPALILLKEGRELRRLPGFAPEPVVRGFIRA